MSVFLVELPTGLDESEVAERLSGIIDGDISVEYVNDGTIKDYNWQLNYDLEMASG